MKKFLTALLIVTTFAACTTTDNTFVPQAHSNLKNMVKTSCSSKEILVGILTDTAPGDIRGRDCKGGLGLCTPKDKSFSFTCMPSNTEPFDIILPSYDSSTNLMTAVAVESTNVMKFYFHRDVLNSPTCDPADWDYFDTAEIKISSNVNLVDGIYPKQIEGDYFIYTVNIIKQ